MERAIVERAIKALAAIGAAQQTVPEHSPVVNELRAVASAKRRPVGENLAPCSSPTCAGCYDVGDGRKIHPPKLGEDYREWLLKWDAKGRVQ